MQGGKPAGRVQFFCEFEMYSEIEMTIKSVEVSGLKEECDPYLQYYFSAIDNDDDDDDAKKKKDKDSKNPFTQRAKGDGKKYKTAAQLRTTTPSWAECDQVCRASQNLR